MMKAELFRGVSLCTIVFVSLLACSKAESSTASGTPSNDYAAPAVAGRIETPDVKESSGLAVSNCQPNVMWTHNDAGSDAFIYAMAPDGKHLGTWRVANAQNLDWEDIAAYKDQSGKCFLYIGDIGDNDGVRSQLFVYRISEPVIKPADSSTSVANALQTEPAQFINFSYPDGKNNAESLIVHPQTGDIYIVTKVKKGPASVYKVGGALASNAKAEKLGTVSMPADPEGLLTGGSISPDGKRVILCDVQQGYELVLPDGANFDSIWQQKPLVVNLGDRKQGEGVSYSADGNSIYAASEKKNATLYLIKRR